MNSNAKKISSYLGLFISLFLAVFFFFGFTIATAESGTFEFGGPFPITMDYSGLTPGECDSGEESPFLSIDAINTTDDHYRIVYASFHNDTAGCEPAFDIYNLSGFSVVGKTEFAAKENGHFDVEFDSSTYSCGRVQYDVGYLNTTTGEVTLFIGQVINYGVDCANPPPTPVCTENASVVVTNPLPATMTPGQTYNFTVKSTNTGNTKWYHGNYFQLFNKTGNLTINPTYGHLPYAMDVNDYNSWTFSVVAPSVPGNYSLDFQMVHKAGADYIKSDGNTCVAPSVDTFFGNSVTLNSSVVAAPTYTLMTTQSGTGSGTVTGAGTYNSGANVTVTASPSEGSTFTGWGNNCSGTSLVTQIVMNSNKICVATFNLNTYTITAVSGANGSVTPAGVTTKNYGTSQVYTITPTTNYRVSDVVVDGVSVGAVNTYTFSNIKANHVIGASFDINQFTLILNKAGTGSGTVTGAGTYNSGVTAVPSATANFGSIFTGWSGDCNAVSGQVVMNSNKTCTANFNLISAITTSLSANPTSMTLPANSTTLTWTTTGSPTSCTAGGAWSGSKSVSGGSQVITGLTAGTHTFNILCSKAGTANTSSSVTVTVSPVVEVNYTLTINKVGTGFGVVDGAGSYLQNTIGRASATANTGSTFVGWSGDCDTNGQVLMNSNKICVATFNLNTYTITAVSGANGSVTPAGVTTKNYGANQIYTITPSLHYHVADVVVDGVSVGAVNTYTFSNIKANHTISSTFAIDQFRLTLNKAGTGTGTVNGAGLYNWGTVVMPGVLADPGSVFTGWSGDCEVNSQVVMSEDRTCTANFNLISAIVVSLEATPDSMTLPANSTTLTWTTTGSPTSCTAGGAWSGSKSVSGGSQVITGLTAGTHTFNILCSKAGTANTSSSVTVTVANYIPPTVTLTANPTNVAYNASSTLNWVSTNSNSCVVSGDWTGNRTLTGSEVVNNLTSNKLYTITCTGLGGVASSSAQVTVASMPVSNLSILKTSDKSTANVGDTVTYTLTLTNNGPDNATEVTVIDILHSGLNFVSASSTSGTYATSTGVWTIGNLNNASTTTLTLVTTVKSGLEGQTIPNTATTTATQNDPTPGNNTSTVNVVVNSNPPCTVNCGGNPTSNLSILKTSDKSTANVGDTITYTITLVNNGPDNATGVSVTDILDSRLNFVSATSTLGSYATSTGIWTIGNLNNASSTTLILVATVKDGNQGQRIPNTVAVTSTQIDPTPGDNTTTVNVDINNPNPPCTSNCNPNPPCTANCGGGGGGGGNGPITPNNLTIFNEQVVETVPGVAFVSWNTNLVATRRVVYGNSSNPVVGSAPNYGYTNSTEIVSSPLLTAHGMVVGVEANKTYYFREISTDMLNGVTRTAIGKELVLNPGNPNTSTSCYYLYDYLRKDFNNNPVEVRKLQVFLRDLEGFSTVQVTGVYDDQTIVALDAFQERYKGDILTPWGHTEPTSYTYILTKKKVNEIYCKMAFPVNTQQQQEIDSYRAFLFGLRSEGIILPVDVTVPPTNNSTTPVATSTLPLLNDIIGLGTSTKSENTTLAGVSTTTMSKFTANILSAWNKIGSWTGLSCEVGSGVSCSCRFINWILIIIIAIISYLWYRERQQNKNIEDINKEIDLNKEKEIDLELFK